MRRTAIPRRGRRYLAQSEPSETDLTPSQMYTLAMCSYIRNEMERIHHLISDETMAEINVTIRYAVYNFLEVVSRDEAQLDFAMRCIPHYWEVPGRDPRPVFTGEELLFGKPVSPEERAKMQKILEELRSAQDTTDDAAQTRA